MNDILKRISPDGRTEIADDKCSFVFERFRPGVLLVTIEGMDAGQFRTAPLDEIRLELMRHAPLRVFVNAQNALGATVEVRQEWTAFFSAHRAQLKGVDVLVGSKYVQLVVGIAQLLSQTGNLIQIQSDPNFFHEKLVRA